MGNDGHLRSVLFSEEELTALQMLCSDTADDLEGREFVGFWQGLADRFKAAAGEASIEKEVNHGTSGIR